MSATALGPAAFGQFPEYQGGGFAGPNFTGLPAKQIETIDLDGDGLRDLVALETDGAITLNRDLVTRSHWERLAGFEAVGVTRSGGDRLWAVASGQLVELVASDFEGTTTPGAAGVTFSLLKSFDLQERPTGSRLVAVDQNGGRVRVFTLVGGAWSLDQTIQPTAAQNRFSDAVLVDWDGLGSDWTAVISVLGLHLYNPAGQDVVQLGGMLEDAFLDALPGSRVKWGRDLLTYHHRPDAQTGHLLWLANSSHGEVHWAPDFGVREVMLADFLPAPGAEMAVALGSSEDVWILRQTVGGTIQDPIFEFDLYDVFNVVIDLKYSVAVAPAGAVADVDLDGDEDFVLIDDRANKIVVTSNRFDEDLLRPDAGIEQVSGGASAVFDLFLEDALPSGATAIDLEVWGMAAPYESGPELLLPLSGLGPTTHQIVFTPPTGDDPVYQFVFRATSSNPTLVYPAIVLGWQADPEGQTSFQLTGAAYLWPDKHDGGGGTTRDPVTGPPTGNPGGGG